MKGSNSLMFLLSVATLVVCSLVQQCYADCSDRTYTTTSGYLAQSKSSGRCSTRNYDIELKDSSRIIELNWNKFYMDGSMPYCTMESVKVFAGCNYARIQIGEFCSQNLIGKPHKIYARGCLRIQYRQLSNDRNGYFNLTYKSYSNPASIGFSSTCLSRSNVYSTNGIIAAPSWPVIKYRSMSCSWKISVSRKYVVQVNVMDMDFKDSFYCSSSNDYLSITGKKSDPYTYFDKRVCLRFSEFTSNTQFTTENYQVSVSYVPAFPYNRNRGFLVGYASYANKLSSAYESDANTYVIVGTVIPLFVFFVVLAAVFRMIRIRRLRGNLWRPSCLQEEPASVLNTPYQPPQQGAGMQPGPPPPAYPGLPEKQQQNVPYPPTSAGQYLPPPHLAQGPYPPLPPSGAPYPPPLASNMPYPPQ